MSFRQLGRTATFIGDRVTVTYENYGTADARPVITPKPRVGAGAPKPKPKPKKRRQKRGEKAPTLRTVGGAAAELKKAK